MGDEMTKRWQIGLSGHQHNANIVYEEGSSALKGESICVVSGIYQHHTLAEIEECAAEEERVAAGLANARLIVMAPELFEFVELCAVGGNPHAQKLVDAVKNGKPRETSSGD